METDEKSGRPKFRDRISFQGVAIGSDESFDLSAAEYQQAKELFEPLGSRADSYREVRPKSRGLLLLYPINPKITENGITRNYFNDKATVIGLALSFPGSTHDTGFDYVCNPRSLREMLGPIEEDFERDEKEEEQPI